MRERVLRGAAAVLVAVAVAGCGSPARPVPSASVDTAIKGWERWSRIAWRTEPKGEGQDLYSYVYNDSTRPAVNVRLLAQAFDESGTLVGQKLERLSTTVAARDRAYVRITGVPAADTSRVTVWTFEFLEIPAWRTR
jgi:hypothetical protein